MKISAQALSFVLCLGVLGAFSQSPGVTPTDNSRVSCSAFANLQILQTEVGRCTGVASANCEAVAAAENAFNEAIENWVAEDGLCDSSKAEAAARACARAMVGVYTDAIAKVSCSGGGFACGWASSNGEAWAISFARAVAQIAATVIEENGDVGVCTEQIEARSGVLAEAAANSQATACVDGVGSASNYSSSFVEEVGTIFVEAFANATVDTCTEGVSSETARARCEARTGIDQSSDTEGEETGAAERSSESVAIADCAGTVASTCCPESFTGVACVCSGCNGAWIRQTDYDADGTRRTLRNNNDDSVCECN